MQRILRIFLATFTASWLANGMSQPLDIPFELLQFPRERQANQLVFCFNPHSLTKTVDIAVGRAIAEALLLDVEFEEMEIEFPLILDYVLPVDEQNLYLSLYSQCDGILGYAYSSNNLPEWLSISIPYLRTPFLVATFDDNASRLGDLPRESRVGTRIGTNGDSVVLAYTLNSPDARRFIRTPYLNNRLLAQRLVDGSVTAALIWEPAIGPLMDEGTLPDTVRFIAPNPLLGASVTFGIVYPRVEQYLGVLFDDALNSLIESGRIDAIIQGSID